MNGRCFHGRFGKAEHPGAEGGPVKKFYRGHTGTKP